MTAYYNEFDPKAAAWLRELIRCGLIADGVVDERSILDVKPEDLRGFTQCHFFAGIGGWSYALRLAGWPDDRPVWTGSPPCQPFSSAGQQKGQSDERHLAPHFAALVAECRPGTLFGEQVASAAVFGKATGRSRKSVEGQAPLEWAWLDDLFERLEAAHYACGASDIPAASVGAPHIRQRTFFGAVRLADNSSPRLEGATGSSIQGRSAGFASGSQHGGMADTSEFGQSGSRLMGRSCDSATGSNRKIHRTVDDGWRDGLADTRNNGRNEDGECVAAAIGLEHSTGDGREQWRPEPSGRGTASGRSNGGLGDASGPTGERDARGVSGAQAEKYGARVAVDGREPDGPEHAGPVMGGLANAEHAERGPICRHGKDGRNGADDGREETHGLAGTRGEVCGRSNAPDSPWGTADWLFCRDGKWRPVEPGTFPLADGVSARVGRLRGYGNAIVPQAAAEFVKAFDAANNECFRLTEMIDEGVFG